jgi:DNA-binding MarR family transcriptional regulator
MPLGKLMSDPQGEFVLPPSRYLAHLLFQVMERRQARLDEALMGVGLNGSKWRVLYGVYRLDGCTMSELARITGIDRTTLTRSVDRLVEEGLIVRSGSPADRRQVILTLTKAGVSTFEAAQRIHIATADSMLDGISEEQQRELCRRLMVMLANVVGDAALTEDILNLNVGQREEAPEEA